jgi:tetratricopeptide (TPR) repeat protein
MKRMKTTITIILAALLSIAAVKAQSLQEGLNYLYADRDKSAKDVFDKLIAANPNNLDAIYWLGQTYIEMQNIPAAKDLYARALQSNGNAPLILVGMGHVELLEGKKDDARQRFETAITLSTGKKGMDAAVLNAVGRANVDAKEGDVAYAVDKLKMAADKDPKNADIFINLGDAYRKAHEGGQAVTTYEKATAANTPTTTAREYYRTAKLYETQKNWDVYVDFLNKAIAADPKFAPAYYELYYYNLGKLDFTTAQDFAAKYIANTDQDPQNDYLRVQTYFFQKDYDQAISGAKNLITAAGTQTKPRTYKLLAYSYVGKGDTSSAKQYIDEYFAKAKEEEIIPGDLILKGQIYGAVSGDNRVVLESYLQAANMDSVYETKMKTLADAMDFFKRKNDKVSQAAIGLVQYKTRKTTFHTDLFNAGLALYQGAVYPRADSVFRVYIVAYPDSIYGYYWDALTNLAMDTTYSQEPYVSNIVGGFKKTLELGITDKEKYKSQAIRASQFLAAIYNNTKKDKDSAIYFIDRGLEFDASNAALLGLKQKLQAAPTKPPTRTNSNTPGNKPTGATKTKSEAIKTATAKTVKKTSTKSTAK